MATGTLTGQTIANTYKSLLKITGTTAGGETLHATTLKVAEDGDGNASPLQIAQNRIEIVPVANHANAFEVSQADGTQIFNIASDTPAASLTGTLSITTADNSDTISLISTDADANSGPNLRLYRNSGSPAGNDLLGNIQWEGRNNNSQDVVYAEMRAQIETTTDGSEDANFKWSTMKAGTSRDRLSINANATVFNDDSVDVDFRVESDGNANMLFVDAGNDRVGIGTASPASPLHVYGEITDIVSIFSNQDYTQILFGDSEASNKCGSLGYRETDNNIYMQCYGDSYGDGLIIGDGGNVGIGTTAPAGAINIAGSGVGANLYIDAHIDGGDGPNLIFRKSNNATVGGFTEVDDNDILGQIYFQGADSDSWETGAAFRATATQDWTGSARGSKLEFYTVDNSTTTADLRMVVDHNGKVGIGASDPGWSLDINNNETGDWAMHLGGDLDANGRWTGILMGYHSSSLYNKAGIVFKSYDATRVRGDLHFCIDDTDDDGNVADTEVAMTVYRTKNIGIGDTAPTDAKLMIDSVLAGDNALRVKQDQNNVAVYIDNNGTDSGIELNNTGSTGRGIYAYSNIGSSANNALIHAYVDHVDFDQNVLLLQNDGASQALNIDQNGNANAIRIDSESTTSSVFHIDTPTATSGSILNIDSANSLTSGAAIRVSSSSTALATTAGGGLVEIDFDGNAGATANNLLFIKNDHSSSTGTTCLAIQQDAANYGLNIDQNADQIALWIDSEATTASTIQLSQPQNTSGEIVKISDCNALTSGTIMQLHSNSDDNSARKLFQVINDHTSATGTVPLYVQNDAGGVAIGTDGAGIFANETSNANMSLGITINQGGHDDEILCLKSSDVAHGMTDNAETDSYGVFGKVSAANGGLWTRGYCQDVVAQYIDGMSTNGNTTKSTSGEANVMVRAWKKSSNSWSTIGADENCFSVGNGNSVKFIVDEDGELHSDGGAQSAYDSYDDAQLVRAYDLSNSKNVINSKWDEYIKYNEDTLVKAKLIGDVPKERQEKGERPLVNVTGMQRLHNGAIWQQYTEMQKMKELMYDMMIELVGKEKADAKLKDHDIKLLDENTLLN